MPTLAGHRVPAGRLILFALELAVVSAAAFAGWTFASPGGGVGETALVGCLGCVVAIQGTLYLADLYDLRVAADDHRSGRRLRSCLGAAGLATVPLIVYLPVSARPRMVWALAAAVVATAILRAAAPWRPLRRRVFLVGDGAALAAALREVETGDDAVVGRGPADALDLGARLRACAADLVVVACEERRGLPLDAFLRARLAGIEVLDAIRYAERARRRIPVDLLRPAVLAFEDGFRRSRAGETLRRTLSVATAVVILLAALPVALLVALAIRLDSPGAVLYRQARVGRGGRTFTLWKFRTMRAGAESATGAVWARPDDPRVTRVGAWLRRHRVDELPQLLNVIAGDMDVVGPRPERPELVAELAARIPFYALRHLVRPGITGWAQIRHPYGASVEEAQDKLGYDLYYVRHASLVLDAVVLFHTAKVVVTGRGAR